MVTDDTITSAGGAAGRSGAWESFRFRLALHLGIGPRSWGPLGDPMHQSQPCEPLPHSPRPRNVLCLALTAGLALASLASAHFQELIPDRPVITQETGPELELELTFTHPFEGGPVMSMGLPSAFGVVVGGVKVDLRDRLEVVQREGASAYQANYRVERPGDHVFYLTPAPYLERAEGVFIVHHTKVIVNAYGLSEGWNEPVGLPVEIVPLTRPYDLWTGNLFRGVVLKGGEPVPHAEVEVEWRNDGSVDASTYAFTTQVLFADGNGVFAYAMPRAGWWGFAALLEGDEPIANEAGEEMEVELGGLIWIHVTDLD